MAGDVEAEIEFLKGRQAPKRLRLPSFTRLVFGRDLAHGSDILVDDDHISKAHFCLTCRGKQVSIADLQSTNGTFVNGQEVDESLLFNEDVIAVGETEILFLCPSLPNPSKTSNLLLTGGAGQHISTLRDQSAELIESMLQDRSLDRMSILDRAPEAFLEIGNILATEVDINHLSRHVVRIILGIFEADRVIILSANEDGRGFKPVFGQTAKGLPDKFPPDISKKVIQDCIESESAIRTIGEIIARKGGVKERRIINMMASPFTGSGKLRGAIYVDTTVSTGDPGGASVDEIFTKQHIQLLSAIAGQVGLAIERTSLVKEKLLSEEMYRLLVENANDWIFQVDSQGCFTFLNSLTDRLLGRPREELLRHPLGEVLSPGREDLLTIQLDKTLTGGQAHTFEVELAIRGRENRTISVSLAPIENKPGEIIGALGVGRDITMEREVQEQLARSERLSSLGKLVAGMAHELNNPLTSIIGFAQLLSLDPKAGEEVQERARLIFKEGERAKEIVQNLLTFAQPQKARKVPLGVNALLERVINIEKYEFERSGVEVIKILNPDIPPIVGDLNQLIQVFLHVVNNGRLAVEDGGRPGRLIIKTWTIVDTVHVSVADDGIGIPNEDLGRIFDPFFTTREVGKGTGLGLSISYKIIKSHGGNITVNSTMGEGTTFEFIFPAAMEFEAE